MNNNTVPSSRTKVVTLFLISFAGNSHFTLNIEKVTDGFTKPLCKYKLRQWSGKRIICDETDLNKIVNTN